MWKNHPSLMTGRIYVLYKADFVGFCYFPMLSSKLTVNLKAQTSFCLSFLFLFPHTCCLSPPFSCLVLWSPLVVDFHPPCPHSLTPVCPSFPPGCAVATVGYGVGVSTDCQSTPLPLLLLLHPTPPLLPPP